MAEYKLTKNGVRDLETGACIPSVPGNRHWQEYLEWLDAGNTPEPIETEAEILARKENEAQLLLEKKVAKKIREMAIAELEKDGEITSVEAVNLAEN